MASFTNVQRDSSCPALAGRVALLAGSTKRAALSNAAVDAAVVAPLELATLQCNDVTSTSSQPGVRG